MTDEKGVLDVCAGCHHQRHHHTKKLGGCRRHTCTCPAFVERKVPAKEIAR